MVQMQEKKQQVETVPEEAQTLDLLDKDVMSAILNILIELKEMKSKKLKESMRIISH